MHVRFCLLYDAKTAFEKTFLHDNAKIFSIYTRRHYDRLYISLPKIVSVIRIYHNHKLQTNPWLREEEPHKNQETTERQAKQLALPSPSR